MGMNQNSEDGIDLHLFYRACPQCRGLNFPKEVPHSVLCSACYELVTLRNDKTALLAALDNIQKLVSSDDLTTRKISRIKTVIAETIRFTDRNK